MQSSSSPCNELASLRNCALRVSFGRSRDDGSEVTTSGIAKVGRVSRITEIKADDMNKDAVLNIRKDSSRPKLYDISYPWGWALTPRSITNLGLLAKLIQVQNYPKSRVPLSASKCSVAAAVGDPGVGRTEIPTGA